jgi:hypothetical protein
MAAIMPPATPKRALYTRGALPLSPLSRAALFSLGALIIRLYRLDARSFWLDEGFSAWLASQPVSVILSFPDFHPPIYYLMLKAWGSLCPPCGTDAGLRLPSAVASALSVGLAVWLIGRLALPGANLVGWLGALSSMSVWYGQEARMYALAGLAATGAAAALALALVGSTQRDRNVAWVCYTAAGVLGLWLHYDLVLVLGGLNAAFLFAARGRRTVAWLVANGIVAILAAPTVPGLLSALARTEDLHTISFGSAKVFSTFLVSSGWPLVGAILVAGLTALLVFARSRRGIEIATMLACVLLVSIDVAEVDVFGASIKRHGAIVLPLVLTVAGSLVAGRMRQRWQVLLVVAGLPALLAAVFIAQKEDWRGAAAVMTVDGKPEDTYVLYSGWMHFALDRYYQAPGTLYLVDRAADVTTVDVGERRVWLVESETSDPPTLAPYFAAERPLLRQVDLYRVTVRLFGSPPIAPKGTGP